MSGTTGWLDRFEEAKALCAETQGAFLYASNFSIGVNLFFNLNAYLARLMRPLKDYDVELEEIHHVHKLDAPSGTAITLAEGILNESDKESWSLDKESPADLFSSEVDSIEIKHTAHSRTGFALGAVVASEWLFGKRGVFGMKDVLDL